MGPFRPKGYALVNRPSSVYNPIKADRQVGCEIRATGPFKAPIEARFEAPIEARFEAPIEARFEAPIEARFEAPIEDPIKA
jgi:hypothetical protein